jgi:transcription-repair coupling factor (superfamily II helicase)
MASASHDPVHELTSLLERGMRRVELIGARGAYGAYVLRELARALETTKPRTIIAVTPRSEDARRLARDLRFFLGIRERPMSLLEDVVLLYPERGTSPYTEITPERAPLLRRLAVLFALAQGMAPRFLVLPMEALQEKVIPRAALSEASDFLVAGDTCDRDALIARLVAGGYARVPLVEDAGTFAVRGFMLDVYSPLYRYPVRVELNGDHVESLRLFDASDQRSVMTLREAYFGPVREELYTEAATLRVRRALQDRGDEAGMPTLALRRLLHDLDEHVHFFGVEALLPGFHASLSALFEYLPRDACFWLVDPVDSFHAAGERFRAEASARTAKMSRAEPSFPADAHFLSADEIEREIDAAVQIRENPLELAGAEAHTVRVQISTHEDLARAIAQQHGQDHALAPLVDRLHAWKRDGAVPFIACHTRGQRERLRELLGDYGVQAPIVDGPFSPDLLDSVRKHGALCHLIEGDVSAGFRAGRLVLVAEEEIFGKRARRRPARSRARGDALSSLRQLAEGDFVVHTDHGIGRYLGLTRLRVGGAENDFAILEYAGGDKLYLPVLRLNRLQKYVGGEGDAKLDKMGGDGFETRKRKVKQAAMEIARELVLLYAAREAAHGISYSAPDAYFREFEASFPFDETPDQMKAIDEVLEDMQRERPMDRLLVGDVGFGKTEVAMRAAMKAALDGKQVAVLVPTTILAQQHENNFRARMRGYPVRVEGLSRFKSRDQQREILADVAAGKVDIVIGTHRLLSEDVTFRDLGLLVIDEEHRFGVKAKERLKELRKNIDVLAMTATPIPRSLHFATGGLRDLSVIQTAPDERLAIRTVVMKFHDDTIQQAIRTELLRGGKVYFVHNRIESLFALAKHLAHLVPEARIAVAHGQMPEKQLEQVMLDFVDGQTNLLVSTAIIESGLDIPKANSIFINRADRFGLAELHQLRGRVGRSSARAYAYLLVPPRESLSPDALRRLEVLTRFSDLGGGFNIATEDLEIRGAGNLLGTAQTGHIAAVGFDLYQELVGEALAEVRGEAAEKPTDPEIQVDVSAFIPDEYLPDAGQRLTFYRRISRAATEQELDDLLAEIEDRFGAPPPPLAALRDVLLLKIQVAPWNVVGLTVQGSHFALRIGKDTRLSPAKVIALLDKSRGRYRLTPDMVLARKLDENEMHDRFATVRRFLREIGSCVRDASNE